MGDLSVPARQKHNNHWVFEDFGGQINYQGRRLAGIYERDNFVEQRGWVMTRLERLACDVGATASNAEARVSAPK
jgi:hypothetical protein